MIKFLVDSVMMPLLVFFYGLTGSYGWAIVFLTLAVKSALMPLTFQSIKSSLEMQKVQPKLKELQQKYKDKPEIAQKKIMEFYKENKVNPLGGCLPILVQMPFFIGLYSTFVSTQFKDMILHGSNNPSFLFIQDLTRIGVFNKATATLPSEFFYDNMVLVILFGLTTFISQKMMMTSSTDPMQKQMLYLMPPMITFMFIMVPVPSGALLYIVISNFITMAQNLFVINKRKSVGIELALEGNNKTSIIDKIDNKKLINLSKASVVESIDRTDDNLSPVLVSAGKSKRAKKKQKKNRNK
ncbi:MAG: membrane protein insertase YidC [Candidatus Sericytochromatia bacterium]|nr:membrane protein insertase YidC [Candidatus Sericytochromatia bacterium]